MFYMTALVLAAILVLFGFNLISMFWNPYPETYIAHNQIRGMATQYHGKLYTLNFDQQNEVIDLLNKAVAVTPDQQIEGTKPEIEKLIIYRFNSSDIDVTPISLVNDQYILSVPAWKKDGYLKDVSSGELVKVLSNTYDH